MQMITKIILHLNQQYKEMKMRKIAQLEACISEIILWMRTNFLKLNNSKTEVIM